MSESLRPLQLTRREFDAFWSETLGDDWYVADTDVPYDVWDNWQPDETITVGSLTIAWEGVGSARQTMWISEQAAADEQVDFFALFAAWRSTRLWSKVTVAVPAGVRAELEARVAHLGGITLT